jgi:glutathione synthase/RimK-type ligase-like ATP-grasp enzyme
MVHVATTNSWGTALAKGGKARAAKLSPEQRSEIAKKAAAARWDRQT